VSQAPTQILSYVFGAFACIIAIAVGVFGVYPAVKARIAKLRAADIRPTLKRVIFLQKTLQKYPPLLPIGDRTQDGLFPQDFIEAIAAPAPAAAERVVAGKQQSSYAQFRR